jgi:hypothetical protein
MVTGRRIESGRGRGAGSADCGMVGVLDVPQAWTPARLLSF